MTTNVLSCGHEIITDKPDDAFGMHTRASQAAYTACIRCIEHYSSETYSRIPQQTFTRQALVLECIAYDSVVPIGKQVGALKHFIKRGYRADTCVLSNIWDRINANQLRWFLSHKCMINGVTIDDIIDALMWNHINVLAQFGRIVCKNLILIREMLFNGGIYAVLIDIIIKYLFVRYDD